MINEASQLSNSVLTLQQWGEMVIDSVNGKQENVVNVAD